MSPEKKRSRRGWLWAVLVFIIAVPLALRYVKPQRLDADLTALADAAKGSPTYTVAAGIVREHVDATGALSPKSLRLYQADSVGKVTSIRVKEGARVASGATLYEFQASSYMPAPAQPSSPVKVTAAFKGVIASVSAEEGSLATAGQPIMTLIDDSSYCVRIELDEVDLTRVAVGMPATVTFDALKGVELPGSVTSVGMVASPRGGVVTLPVEIGLAGTDERLITGLTSHARITVSEHGGELRIPVRAWIDWKGKPSAIVVEGEGIRLAELDTGVSDGEFTQVLSGLNEGDVIVDDAVAAQARAREITGESDAFMFRMRRQED